MPDYPSTKLIAGDVVEFSEPGLPRLGRIRGLIREVDPSERAVYVHNVFGPSAARNERQIVGAIWDTSTIHLVERRAAVLFTDGTAARAS
jgi:hypothetical protein